MCSVANPDTDDDDRTVITSNCLAVNAIVPIRPHRPHAYAAAAQHLFGMPTQQALNAITIDAQQAIADTGATSIFIMDGVDVDNKRVASNPITINLPDGRKVLSTHKCDFIIPGLPTKLVGHVVPGLAVASLVGIRPLCKAGCKVIFDDEKCDVVFNGKVILQGLKDPSTDLWTLPIKTAKMWAATDVQTVATTKGDTVHPGVDLAGFTHSVRTRGNGVKFAHQSLCNPKISTLLKAVRRGFLRGCPNMTEKLILKYLNPSPATAKGHMKRPRHGIQSTRRTGRQVANVETNETPTIRRRDADDVPPAIPPIPILHPNVDHVAPIEVFPAPAGYFQNVPHVIDDDEDASIANVFCSAAFADKVSGVVYSDLTGNFPFMSFDGNVCFLVVYHYETNAIMATPIAGLDDRTIFNAYKAIFQELTAKGFKPKLNVMDNQATKYIKQFLTEEECKLQLVEPHNHRVNAAERAIQTFKDAFIAALATTDRDFPLQLWDKLTPQIITCLNLLRASRIDPSKSAHEIVHGPYDWNRYPLAPLGCKAVVYEDGDTRGSWASRGVDGWYLGPSLDHYRCDKYYIPETRAYRISGSTELFPQHCQLPDMTPHQHFRALTDELTECAHPAGATTKGRRLLNLLRQRIDTILHPPLPIDEQRVDDERREAEQRVIDDAPILTIQRISDAPAIMEARNPTAKRALKNTPRLHRRVTRNNTPGILPITQPDDNTPVRRSTRNMPSMARQRLVTQHALNALTFAECANMMDAFTPRCLLDDDDSKSTHPHLQPEHFASPMVHPITGETISSYKRLMHDPATSETWQTAFGKDFGGMAQGDDKTGQKGTNAMFVMSHDEIRKVLKQKKKFTYGNPVVDYRPQKEDPNRIRITAGGNLVTYESSPSVRTADLDTAKLHWNSVISTDGAKYMCLDIKNFYLTAKLDYFEYMRMPLSLFPLWTQKQYDMKRHALDGMVHLEMRRAVWGLPQAGILANKRLRRKLAPFGYHEHAKTPGLWYHDSRPISFTLVVDDFGVKYVDKADADHLIKSIRSTYMCTEDWTGDLYCGISLGWDYDARTVDISMPGYIKKKLQEYKHVVEKKGQTCPYTPAPKQYGSEAQAPLPPDDSPLLDKAGIKRVQQIVGSILYYARAVDMTVLMALSTIAAEQTKATTKTMARCRQLLDYLAANSEAKVRYHASDMVLNIHSDASYLTEAKARSRLCGHFFMGWIPKNGEPIKLNGAFHVSANIMRFVVASAAEAELGALYHNCQTAIVFRDILKDMGHPQPKTPVHCDNATAVGIANNTVKRQRSRSMEMRFFWISDKIAQEMYQVVWHPGQENLADYQSKHHPGGHHVAVRPWYLHMDNSPRVLPRALKPSTLKGCVGTLKDGYLRKVPLPRAPLRQSPALAAVAYDSPIPDRQIATLVPVYSQVPRVPTWSELTNSLFGGLGARLLRAPLLM